MADIETILRNMTNETNAKTFQFNRDEAQKARDFQADMSNTSHQREVDDLKRAGLNPVLSANGGAQAYSAASASGSADNSAVGALASIYMNKQSNMTSAKIAAKQRANELKIAKLNAKVASKSNSNAKEIAKINAAASKYASDNASSAQRYASDNTAAASRYASDVSYSGHTYGVDRTKYGMAYNAYQGATGKGAKGTGQTIRKYANVFLNWIKKKK